MQYLPILESFTEESLPNLTEVTLGALELLKVSPLPATGQISQNTLFVGSGNALCTGRIISQDKAFYASESNFQEVFMHRRGLIDRVVIISASGGKHAVEIAKFFSDKNIPTWLYTNNPTPLAGQFFPKENIVVFPKNREPYTYNVSTYLGMILSETKEDPEEIRVLVESILPNLPTTLSHYDSYFFLVPPTFELIAPMVLTKFDELFGSRVTARVFSIEGAKHAKTLVQSEKELFISVGVPSNPFNKEAYVVSMPLQADYATYICVLYAIIGAIQEAHPPYFKENIARYVKESSEAFAQDINVIVT